MLHQPQIAQNFPKHYPIFLQSHNLNKPPDKCGLPINNQMHVQFTI